MTVYAVCVAEVSFESERLICVLIAAEGGYIAVMNSEGYIAVMNSDGRGWLSF
jgi:hypothetical protein